MTRPKVPEDKRQRTAQACDTCKRRKQKCNGLKPCNTCTKRNLTCAYTPNAGSERDPPDTVGSPTKKRHVEDASKPGVKPEAKGPSPAQQPQLATPAVAPTGTAWEPRSKQHVNGAPLSVGFDVPKPTVEHPNHKSTAAADDDYENRTRHSTASGPDEEAVVYSSTRMLQDPTGRLLYVGDSASLSYLQLIRMIVESISGPSQFTMDPSRHKLLENIVTIPPEIRAPHILPDRETANILVDSYFTNTHGLIEVFNRKAFESSVAACYSDPLSVSSNDLCLLYLVFAIGLVLATPFPGGREDAVIKRLRDSQFDRAEVFFRSAKSMGDPVSGFEDADFWSVQALSLMSVYMLAVSRRNAAYAYYGMAVRSAFALGLHRVSETMVIFKTEELTVRRNLWRSLFILDRFLAASLGRPTAISEDDCSDESLASPERSVAAELSLSSSGLDAAVRSCQAIGQILKRVYSKRKISTRVALEIAEDCKTWMPSLHPDLHYSLTTNGPVNPIHGVAILHVNLLYYHSIILLTRPFFLHLFTKVQEERMGGGAPRFSSRMERFCEACVTASTHTIHLVQVAYDSHYLPQRNPFVMYFLFAASLIILSNEFAPLYKNVDYEASITKTIAIMSYCAETDPQAARLLFILNSFRAAVAQRRQGLTDNNGRIMVTSANSSYDPIASLFPDHSSITSISKLSRKNSNSFATGGSTGTGGLGGSPIGHKATPMPPPTVGGAKSHENGIGNLPRTAGVSPVTSMAMPNMGDSMSDQADSLGGDAEFDFDSLWNWPSMPAAAGTAGHAPGIEASNAAFHAVALMNPPRYDGFGAFGGVPGSTAGETPININANVPLYAPSQYH